VRSPDHVVVQRILQGEPRCDRVGHHRAAVVVERADRGVHSVAAGIAGQVLDLGRELVGHPQVIAVIESDPVAARRAHAGVARRGYPEVARLVDDADPRQEAVEVAALVRRGAVVDDDHLVGGAPLAPHRCQAVIDEARAVVVGDDDRDPPNHPVTLTCQASREAAVDGRFGAA
jgi:hypothetical protein